MCRFHFKLNEIMEDNFSPNIKEVIGFSREEALRLSNNCIGTEHFILGIIKLKKDILRIQFSGAMLVPCAMEKDQFMKAESVYPASCDGQEKFQRGKLMMG